MTTISEVREAGQWRTAEAHEVMVIRSVENTVEVVKGIEEVIVPLGYIGLAITEAEELGAA